jgi:hypothetical protein
VSDSDSGLSATFRDEQDPLILWDVSELQELVRVAAAYDGRRKEAAVDIDFGRYGDDTFSGGGTVMKTLIVSNFPDETTEEQIKDLFREYQVEKVTLRPKKYAVVTFKNENTAEEALKEWREVVWSRHWLRVKPGRW